MKDLPTADTKRHKRPGGPGRHALPDELKAGRGTLRPCRVKQPRKPRAPAEVVPAEPRDYLAIAEQYVVGVCSGAILAGKWTILACQRFKRMRDRAQGSDCPFVFSPEQVVDVCGFVERLPHVEGRWPSPTIVLEPWQVFILAGCYGFRVRETGRRLVTVVFFEVARKSAKSTLVAAAALYHLVVEREPGAQVVAAATTGAQARIVFSIMQRMVRRSLWLRQQGLMVWANAITLEEIGATAKPINSKSSSQDGLSPSFISLDESHAQTFALRDVLVSAMGARVDGMIWCPTTAGYDMLSVGFALRSHAMKILERVVESDHTFVILYELDEGDQWDDARLWQKSCPMIGITPSVEYLNRYCLDAQQTPGLQGEFKTKVCDWWLHSASNWLSMATWDKCAEPTLRLEQFAGEPCWIGGDLAQLDDIAAVALVFQRGGVLYGFVRCYLPAMVVQERSRAVPEYSLWVRDGLLTLTEGTMIDYARIEADVRAWCKQFAVKGIAFDQFGSVQITGNLFNDGLPASVEPKNAKTFTGPARELETRLKHGRFCHDGNSCLKWMASNCVVDRRVDGSILPKKETPESPNKIDGIDALLQAIGAMLHTAPKAEPSYTMFILGGR